jgi:hypothetical protein
MTPDLAAKIVAPLDAELERRRTKRDSHDETRWRQESDCDGIYVLARIMDRAENRPPAQA